MQPLPGGARVDGCSKRATMLHKRAMLLHTTEPVLVKTDNVLADLLTKSADKGTYTREDA